MLRGWVCGWALAGWRKQVAGPALQNWVPAWNGEEAELEGWPGKAPACAPPGKRKSRSTRLNARIVSGVGLESSLLLSVGGGLGGSLKGDLS